VFVVDASNNSNQSVVVSEIKSLLGDARLASVPILVLANKQVMLILKLQNIVSINKFPYLLLQSMTKIMNLLIYNFVWKL